MSVSLPFRRRHLQIDVSLAIVNIVLLLIFFFVVSGQVTGGAQDQALDLPETADLPLDQLPRPILIVSPEGWTLDGEPVAPELLGVALEDLPHPLTLHLLIDRAASADTLIGVLGHPALQDIAVRLVTLRHRGGRA